jgi:hypothetical protein
VLLWVASSGSAGLVVFYILMVFDGFCIKHNGDDKPED